MILPIILNIFIVLRGCANDKYTQTINYESGVLSVEETKSIDYGLMNINQISYYSDPAIKELKFVKSEKIS